MGSGCVNSNTSGKKCANITPIGCIKWTGDPIPSLGICTGDMMDEVTSVILTKLLTIIDGTGIVMDDLVLHCDIVKTAMLGKANTLFNFLQALFDISCTVNAKVDSVTAIVTAPTVYDLKCLTPPSKTDTPSVLQQLIIEFCAVVTKVNALTADILETDSTLNNLTTTIQNTTGNQLLTSITSCNGGYGITKTGSGKDASISFDAQVPPFSAVFVWNPTALGSFDATGKGKTGTPFCGWFVMNGLNGTPDMRGYTAMGATALPGITGPGLQSAVDPTTNADLTYGTNIGDRKGEVKHKLTISEIPSHIHNNTISDTGHTHHVAPFRANLAGGTNAYDVLASNPTTFSTGDPNTSSTSSNVSIVNQSIGGDIAHENRQPSFAGFWITRLM